MSQALGGDGSQRLHLVSRVCSLVPCPPPRSVLRHWAHTALYRLFHSSPAKDEISKCVTVASDNLDTETPADWTMFGVSRKTVPSIRQTDLASLWLY